MTAFRCTTWALISSTIFAAHLSAADVDWEGAIDSNASDGANWLSGAAPTSADRARFRFGDNPLVDIGAGATWGQIWFNSAEGGTTIDGTGTLNLAAGAGTLAIQSVGGSPVDPRFSTINPDITTAGIIEGNSDHSLIFNGDVSAGKFQAFSGATLTFNGSATHTGAETFITFNATGRINFAGNFTNTLSGDLDLNGDGGAAYFASFTPPTANQTINLHSGKTIGNLADNAFGEAVDIFARSNSTYDLNGFSETVEFLGTNVGNILTINFGALGDANELIWRASHNMGVNAMYNVVNFEVGSDALQLGGAGPQFFNDDQLAQITINGVAYSATDPGDGSTYWTRDANQYVQFVPEPTSLLLASSGLLLLARHGRRQAA